MIDRVMLIDDDEINNLICVKTMREVKFAKHISTYVRAKEGLNSISKAVDKNGAEIPDVIFLDINMPVMNGWDFLEEFRGLRAQIDKEIMVFVLSSSINDKDINLAIEHDGVDDYLIKPLNKGTLREVLATHFP